MKYLTGNEIRRTWIDFFREKGHNVEPSASLIPNNDPTLLWINSGVAALKKYFDGSLIPNNPRIVNAQKCLRTNDIENVGKTARHHTFFEMLGNFSIGDYFRDEMIPWAYELLTSEKWFGFDKELLYFTVYPSDFDTFNKWLSVGVKPDHIIKTDYNYWEIGEGPSGPCTEIWFDRGEKYDKRGINLIKNDIENDRYIEIWNIVFSQYNAKPELDRSEYKELPSKNIDTGMGLERMACIIQNVETNFDTDFFIPIIKKIEEISKVKYNNQMAFKVISDHVRTVTFSICDGALLSNEGRGYVLRRLLRRAVKYGKSLGIKRPFLSELVDVVSTIMSDYYPYLEDNKDIVKNVIKIEEEKFLETLLSGEKRIESIIKESSSKIISKHDAFTLYDTYGFPIELTIEYANEYGYEVDVDGFKEEMEKRKELSRNARKSISSMKSQNEEYLNFKQKSTFVGYNKLEVETEVIKVFKDGIVLDKTPFYAESGGQLADSGLIYSDLFKSKVIDVQKLPNSQFIHHIEIIEGEIKEGMKVVASVDKMSRNLTMYNHSATHLLFKALRNELGNHVSQQGSQVSKNNLRFDFNNFDNLSDETLLKIERDVNKKINEAIDVKIYETSIDEAKKMGAIAEFGEKYESLVRVIDIDYTLDLCGGTHVKNTSEIRKMAIIGIESKGSGIFRIEALTNENIRNIKTYLTGFNKELENLVKKAQNIVNEASLKGIKLDFKYKINDEILGSYEDIINKRKEFVSLQKNVKDLEKEFIQQKEKMALSNIDKFVSEIVDDKLITKTKGYDTKTLKQLVDSLLNKIGTGFVFVANIVNDKIVFIAKSNNGVHCGKIVKEAAVICEGNGGGRPDMAQAGGKDISKVDDALDKVRELVK